MKERVHSSPKMSCFGGAGMGERGIIVQRLCGMFNCSSSFTKSQIGLELLMTLKIVDDSNLLFPHRFISFNVRNRSRHDCYE